MKTLILGGARSGKSRLAEQLAKDSGLNVIYIATACAGDDEMALRIARHQSHRASDWLLVEEPIQLLSKLQQHANTSSCLLIDCLTLWVANLLADGMNEGEFSRLRDELAALLVALPGQIFFVSNEVGHGVIPMGALNRRFVDELGLLHQTLAKHCDRVIMTVAGLVQILKGPDLESH